MNAQESDNSRCRVLVVDDDHDGADSLAEVLRLIYCIDSDVAYDGQTACSIARSRHPQTVVLDLELRLESGFDVADSLLNASPSHPPRLVAVTGNAQLQARAADDARFAGSLIKPPDLPALVRLIEH
jgi:CheY-like chemotaxis protein